MQQPPEGCCWRLKPRLHTWPERYAKLEGRSLNFYKKPYESSAAEDASIADLTGCAVEMGVEDWGLQQLPRVVVARQGQGPRGGTSLRFCFADVGLRDDFYNAMLNVAAGREWNAPQVDSAGRSSLAGAEGAAVVAVHRQFNLEVRQNQSIMYHTRPIHSV